MDIKRLLTSIAIALVFSLPMYGEEELDPVRDFRGKETIPTQEGIALKQLMALLRVHDTRHPGSLPSSWDEIRVGEQPIRELLDYDITEDFYFARNDLPIDMIDGRLVFLSTKALPKGPRNSLIRYIIWKKDNGEYAIKSIKEEEFDAFLKDHKIKPLEQQGEAEAPQSEKQKNSLRIETSTVVQNDSINTKQQIDPIPSTEESSNIKAESENKTYPWWPWVLGGLVLLVVVAWLLSRKRE